MVTRTPQRTAADTEPAIVERDVASTDVSTEGEPPAVLAICDFSANLGKVERHIGPLTATANPTMVCITADDSVDGVNYRTVPDVGWRPVGLVLMFIVALHEAFRGEYDAVVSFSLVPHGCFALLVARLAGLPVHLGIIGEDLDVHARAWYGEAIAFLFRRFDVVSVPGQAYRHRLRALGVRRDRAAVLANPIDPERYRPDETVDAQYDLLWVGRFGPEKDPTLFVDACALLKRRGVSFTAAMVGDGPLRSQVESRIRAEGLTDRIEVTGWVDDPVAHYRQARVFALTSRRDALPLTLVEAMATGCVPVAPAIGNVQDAAIDGKNAVIVDARTPAAFADAFETLLCNQPHRSRLAARAPQVREQYSYDAATADWQSILERMTADRSHSVSIVPRSIGST